ncbi:hypothetical protein MMC10_001056 [Thelotrema lepadinum]|nr:hypothetical protein [Thelotrema lepadinum]
MLSHSARRLPLSLSRLASPSLRAYASSNASKNSSTTDRVSDVIPTNDPQPPKDPPNVSASNETPVSMMGIKTGTLQETTEEGEEKRVMQAPNRAGVWSRSQNPRERAMRGPRFEQTIMEMQVSLARAPFICGGAI